VKDYVWPVVTALMSGLLSYWAGRRWAQRQISSLDTKAEFDRVRDALRAYGRWLVGLRLFIDPTDTAGLGQPEDVSPPQWSMQAQNVLRDLAQGAGSGRRLLEELDSAKYDLPLTGATLERLREVVGALDEYWDGLRSQQWPVDSCGEPQYHSWLLAHDSLGWCELDAKEVALGETVISDLASGIHRAYKQDIKGKKAVRGYDRTTSHSDGGVIELRRGRLAYDGPIPFRSQDYLTARASLPWDGGRHS
jgi:hypothetical protein